MSEIAADAAPKIDFRHVRTRNTSSDRFSLVHKFQNDLVLLRDPGKRSSLSDGLGDASNLVAIDLKDLWRQLLETTGCDAVSSFVMHDPSLKDVDDYECEHRVHRERSIFQVQQILGVRLERHLHGSLSLEPTDTKRKQSGKHAGK